MLTEAKLTELLKEAWLDGAKYQYETGPCEPQIEEMEPESEQFIQTLVDKAQ